MQPNVISVPREIAIDLANNVPNAVLLEATLSPQFGKGRCYENVQTKIEMDGGSAVFGWLILCWPEAYMQLMHHAVWRSPEGSLIDVTELPFWDIPTEKTYLIETKNFQPTTLRPFIPNVFFPKSPFHDLIRELQAADNALSEKMRALTSNYPGKLAQEDIAALVYLRLQHPEIAEMQLRVAAVISRIYERQSEISAKQRSTIEPDLG